MLSRITVFILYFALISACSSEKSEKKQSFVFLSYTSSSSMLSSFPATIKSIAFFDEAGNGVEVPIQKPIDLALSVIDFIAIVSLPAGNYTKLKINFDFTGESPWLLAQAASAAETQDNWQIPELLNYEGKKLSELESGVSLIVPLSAPIQLSANAFKTIELDFLMSDSLLAMDFGGANAWVFSPAVNVSSPQAVQIPMIIEGVTGETIHLTVDDHRFSTKSPAWLVDSQDVDGQPESSSVKGKLVSADLFVDEQGNVAIPQLNLISSSVLSGLIIPDSEGGAFSGHEYTQSGYQFVQTMTLPSLDEDGTNHLNDDYFVPGQQVEIYLDKETQYITKVAFKEQEIKGKLKQTDNGLVLRPFAINGIDAEVFTLNDFPFQNADGLHDGDIVKVKGQFHKKMGAVSLEILDHELIGHTQSDDSTEMQIQLQINIYGEQMLSLGDSLAQTNGKELPIANFGDRVNSRILLDDDVVIPNTQIDEIKNYDTASYAAFVHENNKVFQITAVGLIDMIDQLSQLPETLGIYQVIFRGQLQNNALSVTGVNLRLREVDEETLAIYRGSVLSLEQPGVTTLGKQPSMNTLVISLGSLAGAIFTGVVFKYVWGRYQLAQLIKKQNSLQSGQPAQTPPPAIVYPEPNPLPQPLPEEDKPLKNIPVPDTLRTETGDLAIIKDADKDFWVDTQGNRWVVEPVSVLNEKEQTVNAELAKALGFSQDNDELFTLTDTDKNTLGLSEGKARIRPYAEVEENLGDKDATFFNSDENLSAEQKRKLIGLAMFQSMVDDIPSDVTQKFNYLPESKEIVIKNYPVANFSKELQRDTKRPATEDYQDKVELRNVGVDLERYLPSQNGKPIQFSLEDIQSQVARWESFDEENFKKTLKNSALYQDSEVDEIVKRTKSKWISMQIAYTPNRVSEADFTFYMKEKYLEGWANKYNHFSPVEKVAAGLHKTVFYSALGKNASMTDAYEAFIYDNRQHFLNRYHQSSVSIQGHIQMNVGAWVADDAVSMKDVPSSLFRTVTKNSTVFKRLDKQKQLSIIENYFVEKYGKDFRTRLWQLTKPDLQNFNVFENLSVQRTFDSKEAFEDYVIKKYAAHPSLMNNMSLAEEKFLKDNNLIRKDLKESAARIQETLPEEDLDFTGKKVAYFYSNIAPDKALTYGFTAMGDNNNFTVFSELDFKNQIDDKSKSSYLKLYPDRKTQTAKENFKYVYVVDVNDAESLDAAKNIGSKVFVTDDAFGVDKISPERIHSTFRASVDITKPAKGIKNTKYKPIGKR